MSFENRISNVPIAFNSEAALPVSKDLPGNCPGFNALVYGTTACSPFLRGLVERNRTWVAELPERDPEESFREILETRLSDSSAKAAVDLRIASQKVALLVALADLGGAWTSFGHHGGAYGICRFRNRVASFETFEGIRPAEAPRTT